jgi:hypothetical protein
MLLVVGDEHEALRIEAYRISNASFRQDREQFRLRRSSRQLSYRAGLAEIDDIQVASLVDGGAFDAKCVFAAGRDLPALKLGVADDAMVQQTASPKRNEAPSRCPGRTVIKPS